MGRYEEKQILGKHLVAYSRSDLGHCFCIPENRDGGYWTAGILCCQNNFVFLDRRTYRFVADPQDGFSLRRG